MFSSRGDGGADREKAWPADYDSVTSVSSLTYFGTCPDSAESTAAYFSQGENVSISAEPSYLEPQKHASGSSMATALAAGLAGLILTCRRLVAKNGTTTVSRR